MLNRWLADPKATLRELDRLDCEQDHLRFATKFFAEKEGQALLVGPHHRVMAAVLDRVIRGEIDRLIINVPPGYTKTEMAVVHFMARGLALNPRARFIHASFNGQLALYNSNSVRDVLKLDGYQDIWPISFSATVDAKGLWRTEELGGVMAAAAGGPITGFRAGLMDSGFTGALIIDDPLKPDDAQSEIERERINGRWHSTFKSRLAQEDVPVIVIMQRLHVDDFSGFLLKGGAGCRWHHLLLPVLIDNSAEYPDEYTHGDPIAHGLPDGPLWPAKHDRRQIAALRHNAQVFSGQYMQRPVVSGGNLFKEEWFRGYGDLPTIDWRAIYVDTAQKTGERNDFTVLQCWGRGRDGRAYLLDQVRGRFEAPELVTAARLFWAKHRTAAWNAMGVLRCMKIEDKVSGTGLIQELKRGPDADHPDRAAIPVQAIQRDRDKELRANDVLPAFASDLVRVPKHEPWFASWRDEMLAFPSGTHDDQVDPTLDAVSDMVVRNVTSMLDVL